MRCVCTMLVCICVEFSLCFVLEVFCLLRVWAGVAM